MHGFMHHLLCADTARHGKYKTDHDTVSVVKMFTIISETLLDINKQVSRLTVAFTVQKRRALNDVHR